MSIKLPLIAVNGIFDAAISPLDRGFAYGDGVFETCRVHSGKIPLWQFHVGRLTRSAARLHIPLNPDLLQQYLHEFMQHPSVATLEVAVLKIILTRGVGGRGYRQPDTISPTYCLALFSGNILHSHQYVKGIDVCVCLQRLACNKSLAGIKHLNRLEQVLARAEWQDEYAEGLLLDERGNLIEATASNVFIIRNNQLFTPDLSNAGVAGIMRQVIIEQLAPALGLVVNVIDLDLTELSLADEIFLCNSVYGIWPVITVTYREPPVQHFATHLLTRQLQAVLEKYIASAGVILL